MGLLAAVLLFSLFVLPALEAQQPAGPRPGVNDPASSFLFPSDGIGMIAPGGPGGATQVKNFTFNGSFAPSPGSINYNQPNDTDNFVAASGHIWMPDTEQVVYARRPGKGSQLHVVFLRPGSSPPHASYVFRDFAPRLPTSTDFMAIAAGDLDNLPDSAGNLHDEVVVAYAGLSSDPNSKTQNFKLAVLDYTAPATAPPAPVAVTIIDTGASIGPNSFTYGVSTPGILPIDNVIGLAVGDFDGDGKKEIALANLVDRQTLLIQIWRYSNDGQGHRSLTRVSQTSTSSSGVSNYVGTISLTVGNFTGNKKGGDELLVVAADYVTAGPETIRETIRLTLWQTDDQLRLTPKASSAEPVCESTIESTPFTVLAGRVRVQVAPGLFVYDPNNGFDLNRREFVLGWNLGCGYGRGVLKLLGFMAQGNELVRLKQRYFDASSGNGRIYQRFSLTAGAFLGNGSLPPPLWGIALNYWPDGNGYPTLALLDSNLEPKSDTRLTTNPVHPGGDLQRFPVIAADFSGQSLYLGAPVHFTVNNVINTDFILQEPPKHAFYDNRPASSTYGQVVTVSRYDSTNVALKTKSGTSFSGKSTDSSDWSIGGSVAASAGTTLGFSGGGLAKASFSVDVTAKVGYEYNQSKSNYDSNYSSRTLTETQTTDRDDVLVGRAQLFDLWRYRIYGAPAQGPNGEALNGFYEIVLPGPVIKTSGGGLNYDWYQPLHENGNILSYPRPSNQTFTPPDLGPHQVPCPASPPPDQKCNGDGTLSVTEPLVPAQQTFFDGRSHMVAYDYQSSIGSGNSYSYSHKLAESLDVKVAFEAEGKALFANVGARTSLNVNLNNSNSWSGLKTNDNTVDTQTGLTLSLASGDSSQAYAIYPVFYTTQDGTIKVTHAADALGSAAGRSFWAALYGRWPDPALNLPLRFSPVFGPSNVLIGWKPNLESSRKQVRGFFVESPDPDPVTKTYGLLAFSPIAGDKVRLEARVYNYSTAVAASNLPVRFQVVAYNAASDQETPVAACPTDPSWRAGARCTIGQTTIASLNALEMQAAAITWDTTGFDPSLSGSQQYRVYVVLDPDNAIQETYDTEDPNTQYKCVDHNGAACTLPKGLDPGQNNEGFGYVTIKAPSASLAAQSLSDTGTDVYLTGDSLETVNGQGLTGGWFISVPLDQPLTLRGKVYSSTLDTQVGHLLVYDGDPNQGASVIADKLVDTGNPEGAYTRFTWIPTVPGRHTLYAVVLEREDDTHPGNNVQRLTVDVAPATPAPPQ
jgi:hypothetical protein